MQKYDDKNRGLIDIPTFKAALTDYKIEMNIDELTIFTRYVEKDTDMMIDYVNFTAQLDKLKSEEELQTLSTTQAFIDLEQFNTIRKLFSNIMVFIFYYLTYYNKMITKLISLFI